MASNAKLFGEALNKRERGIGILDFSYRTTWMGATWVPVVASAPDLRKALANGPSLAIADELEQMPAIFELAIAPKDAAGHRVHVYLEGTDNLRDSVKDILNLNGKYRGFLDNVLPKHCIWLRFKTFSSEDNAKRGADKILRSYDYAWNNQKSGSPRALGLSENVFCGCCCHTGWSIAESQPKFKPNESSFKKLMSRG
mmetsp:Transcript_6511/g.17997  ORF Transcript_6511/g.17997 Transcript_6511/m.17997 type:complete len:198 (+) Transcript_6511:1491-2084(+)